MRTKIQIAEGVTLERWRRLDVYEGEKSALIALRIARPQWFLECRRLYKYGRTARERRNFRVFDGERGEVRLATDWGGTWQVRIPAQTEGAVRCGSDFHRTLNGRPRLLLVVDNTVAERCFVQ